MKVEVAKSIANLHHIIEDCDLTLTQIETELTANGLKTQNVLTISCDVQLLTKSDIFYFE